MCAMPSLVLVVVRRWRRSWKRSHPGPLRIHIALSVCYRSGMLKPLASSDDTDAMVARIAPAILALLGDGVPRPKRAIVAALADRHPRDEVIRTLVRLTVTDQLVQLNSKYRLPTSDDTAA